jgi:hypothetical protein
MTSALFTVADEIATCDDRRFHVVILGAGASRAAFPNGDGTGKPLPLMRDLVAVVGLEGILRQHGIQPPYHDFEAIYSRVTADTALTELKNVIEQKVYAYFSSLILPDTASLYDHIVLSLRPKDVIATFNWDPFLWQAANRNHRFSDMPTLLFLHGNVAIGYCRDCKVVSLRGQNCARCNRPLVDSPLLYPVTKKEYQRDPAIAGHWRTVISALKNAWTITFFGYSAPTTDVEAVELMKQAWGNVADRNLEETEIIDIRSEDQLLATWAPFIHTHHFRVQTTFYDSYIARHPRRSCEALWARLMEARFVEGSQLPVEANLEELRNWLQPRLDAEAASGSGAAAGV